MPDAAPAAGRPRRVPGPGPAAPAPWPGRGGSAAAGAAGAPAERAAAWPERCEPRAAGSPGRGGGVRWGSRRRRRPSGAARRSRSPACGPPSAYGARRAEPDGGHRGAHRAPRVFSGAHSTASLSPRRPPTVRHRSPRLRHPTRRARRSRRRRHPSSRPDAVPSSPASSAASAACWGVLGRPRRPPRPRARRSGPCRRSRRPSGASRTARPCVLRPVTAHLVDPRAHDLALLHDDHDLVVLVDGQRADQVAALVGELGDRDAVDRAALDGVVRGRRALGQARSRTRRRRRGRALARRPTSRAASRRRGTSSRSRRRWSGPSAAAASSSAWNRTDWPLRETRSRSSAAGGQAGADQLVAVAQVDGDEATAARASRIADSRVFLTSPRLGGEHEVGAARVVADRQHLGDLLTRLERHEVGDVLALARRAPASGSS